MTSAITISSIICVNLVWDDVVDRDRIATARKAELHDLLLIPAIMGIFQFVDHDHIWMESTWEILIGGPVLEASGMSDHVALVIEYVQRVRRILALSELGEFAGEVASALWRVRLAQAVPLWVFPADVVRLRYRTA